MTKRQILTVKPWGWAAAAVVVAGVVTWSVVGRADPATADESPVPLEVVVQTLAPRNRIEVQREFSGVLKTARATDLSFERTGKLTHVLVSEGDSVSSGQPLAKLDLRTLNARQSELAAQRDAAVALLAELRSGPRREVIDAARAEVRRTEAGLALQTANLRRSEQLMRNNAIAEADYDQSRFGQDAEAAAAIAAKRRLDELEAGVRPEKIEAQQAVVAQLDAALESIAVEISDSTLTAPFDGTISARHLDEGAVVAPGQAVVRVVEAHALEAWIGLPPEDAARLETSRLEKSRLDAAPLEKARPDDPRLGADGGEPSKQDKETFKVSVGAREFEARLSAVLPELDGATRTRTVVWKVAEHANAAPGEIVRVRLQKSLDLDGFWVPTAALLRGSRGLWSVFVIEQNRETDLPCAARRDVELLHTEGDRSFIRGAVRSGERIVSRGVHRIAPRQMVRPIPDDAPSSPANAPTAN